MRIEICGGVATGKTTLAMLLERSGCSVVYEQPEDNPFLKSFYASNAVDNTFETEIVFTLLHYSQVIGNMQKGEMQVSDFSLFQDYCYGLNNLKGEELEQYLSLYRHLRNKTGEPDFLVLTECSLACQLERIRQRGREVEQNISQAYVASVSETLAKQVDAEIDSTSLLVVNTEEEDLLGSAGEAVVKEILTRIRK